MTDRTFEVVRGEFMQGVISLEIAAKIAAMEPDEFLFKLAVYNARKRKEFAATSQTVATLVAANCK